MLTAICKTEDPSHSLDTSAPASSRASKHSKLPTTKQDTHFPATCLVEQACLHTTKDGHVQRCAPVPIPFVQIQVDI